MMYNEGSHRRPFRNSWGGLAAGIFLICLTVVIYLGSIEGRWILPILFVGLAFVTLLTTLSSNDHKATYGGMHGFVWLLGLALCFAIGFWPWILLPIGVSLILGALAEPVMGDLSKGVPPAASPYQPSQPSESQQQEEQSPTPR